MLHVTYVYGVKMLMPDTSEDKFPRTLGTIKVHDKHGYAYIPKMIRDELGIDGKDDIPFVVDANCVLLVRKGASLDSILKGIDILKKDLELRSTESHD